MKKTMIALALAASAVSGMAHAWTNGDFNGSVDIGGSITADDYRQKWSWAIGSGLDGFNNALTELTNGGKSLTITVNGDKPILLGKTNVAFATPVVGGVGAIPLITLSGADGVKKFWQEHLVLEQVLVLLIWTSKIEIPTQKLGRYMQQ